MSNENNSTDEDRFGRQDRQLYSGWSTAVTIAAIVFVLWIVYLVYSLKY